MEKFKSTQLFLKAQDKASLRASWALEHLELLAAVLALGGGGGQSAQEKAFSSRDVRDPLAACIQAEHEIAL